MANTLLDMFLPQPAQDVGTQRVERISNESFDTQIRNAGSDVVNAMLSAARDRIVDIASQTEAGQNIIATAQQQQLQKWLPMLVLGVIVVLVVMVLRK